MRLMVMYDLPVATKSNRKRYQQFHKFLINDGYAMMQFSVYTRITNGLDGVQKHLDRLNANLPSRGSVRVMAITERQYASMMFLVGEPTPQEKTVAAQLQLVL